MRKVLILIILTFGAATIFAQSEESNCGIHACVTDKDPKGLNVRLSPNGKIIGNIPFAKDDDNLVIVEIVGYSKGWVKISSAETVSGEERFSGTGWISAKMVTTSTEQHNGSSDKPVSLYTQPKTTSKRVGTIPSEVNVEIVGFDCFGLKVKYKSKIGWLSTNDMCGNPVTTCP